MRITTHLSRRPVTGQILSVARHSYCFLRSDLYRWTIIQPDLVRSSGGRPVARPRESGSPATGSTRPGQEEQMPYAVIRQLELYTPFSYALTLLLVSAAVT